MKTLLIKGYWTPFSDQIGNNLEVYIDGMVVNTSEEGDHYSDL